MIGQTISHYKITEKLGEGGMGEVYLAEDTSLKRKVALKFLPEYLQQDNLAHTRFLREAQSAAAIDHPYICNIHEVSQTGDGHDYIVMEYVEGQTLKEKLEQGKLPLKEALRIGTEVSEALGEAHKKGVVHRDLKPANIMLTAGGHVKVMDFGLAKKVVDEDGTEQDITAALTREGTTLGTLPYMSPEQLRGKNVDTRTDIFSFGIVLYELLSGVHPFRKPKQAETTGSILHEDPPPLSRYTEDTSEVLQHTIAKMLEKSPDDRYQSVHEVRSNLKRLSEKLSVPDVIPVPARLKIGIWLGAGGAFIALVAFILGVYLYRQVPVSVEEARIDSIAVLPFENVTGDEENEYLSDGIAESIAFKLAKLGRLRIIPSGKLKRYKGVEVDEEAAAEELGVRAVLAGTLALVEDEISLRVRLVDSEGNLRWGDRYRKAVTAVLTLEEEIASSVTQELQLQLTTVEQAHLAKRYTENPKAHDAYLRGQSYFRELGVEPRQAAIVYFERAIDEDPDYVLPYVALAQSYTMMGYYLNSPRNYQKAKEFTEKALRIDSGIAEAHMAMGHVLAYHEHEWEAARREFVRALELEPGCHSFLGSYANYLLVMGRTDQAVAELERMSKYSDPLSRFQQEVIANRYYYAREYDRTLEIAEKFNNGWLILQCYLANGMHQEAFDFLLRGRISDGADQGTITTYNNVYEKSGIQGVIEHGFDEYLENTITHWDLARRYAFVGRKDDAFLWLNRTYELPFYLLFATDIRFDSLRSDPRYEELLLKLNLPEEAIQKHLTQQY